MVDAAERRQHLGTVEFAVEGALGALEFPDRGVAVDGHDQGIAALPRLLEIADMSRVKQIETAVGEYQFLSRSGILRAKGRQFIRSYKSVHTLMGNRLKPGWKQILLF